RKMPNKAVLAALATVLCASVFAREKTPKKIKPGQNPPQYATFAKPLSVTDRVHHALDRLTFGARPGDLEAVQQTGLDKWIEAQLHPERVPENPILLERLAPLDSLRMSVHDTYVHFPPPQMIAAVARGRAPLPDDPELRAIVVRLADKYLQKKNANTESSGVSVPATQLPGAPGVLNLNTPAEMQKAMDAKAQQPQNPNDDSDLDLKVKLTDILTPEQIYILRNGKPDEKRAVLEALPPDKRTDFVWALRPQQRQALFTVAPV